MAEEFGSKQAGSKGGKARAKILSPAERTEIARKAVRARWDKVKEENGEETGDLAPETGEKSTGPFSMFRGPLQLGNLEIECHVLNDLRRVLTQREVVRVLSGGRESGNLGRYISRNPIVPDNFGQGKTISFKIPGSSNLAIGYEATLLIELCDAYLQARDQGMLKKSQLKLAMQAEIVMRSCAKIGIIALIDEATGFQRIRDKRALQMKLQAFVAEEMQEWALMFPDEFWIELARLEGIKYSPRNRPIRWGKYVMAFVYDAVDKDVGRELRKKNPNPHFMKNHHQWLKKHGREKVNNQLQRVIGMMSTCADMQEFRKKFDYVFKVDPWQLQWDDWLRPPDKL